MNRVSNGALGAKTESFGPQRFRRRVFFTVGSKRGGTQNWSTLVDPGRALQSSNPKIAFR